MNSIKTRPAEKTDLDVILQLTEDLGYPSDPAQITKRFELLKKSGSDLILVSIDENEKVTGWIHVFAALRLESDPFAEIGGLVVKEEYRNKGIGKTLVNAGENWAKENGYFKIRVRSRTSRKDARSFYEREGYTVKKMQNVFEKIL